MAKEIARKALRAGGWRLAKRLLKPVPVAGTVLAVGLVGYEMRRKGVVRGAVNSALDATPVVGTVKGLVELFTGDLIPDLPA